MESIAVISTLATVVSVISYVCLPVFETNSYLSPVHFTLTDLFAPLKLESALIADSNAAAIAVFEEYVFAGKVIVPELVPSTFIEKVFPLETVRLLLEEISVAISPLQPETGVKNALSLPFSPPSIKTSLPKVFNLYVFCSNSKVKVVPSAGNVLITFPTILISGESALSTFKNSLLTSNGLFVFKSSVLTVAVKEELPSTAGN